MKIIFTQMRKLSSRNHWVMRQSCEPRQSDSRSPASNARDSDRTQPGDVSVWLTSSWYEKLNLSFWNASLLQFLLFSVPSYPGYFFCSSVWPVKAFGFGFLPPSPSFSGQFCPSSSSQSPVSSSSGTSFIRTHPSLYSFFLAHSSSVSWQVTSFKNFSLFFPLV